MLHPQLNVRASGKVQAQITVYKPLPSTTLKGIEINPFGVLSGLVQDLD
jgi:hypothetical protein